MKLKKGWEIIIPSLNFTNSSCPVQKLIFGSKSEVKIKLKHVLIAAGVVAAVYLLLKSAKDLK